MAIPPRSPTVSRRAALLGLMEAAYRFHGMVEHMALADLMQELLDQRRPHRADARRNFDKLLEAATRAFTEHGADVGMEEIARRAGVGIATLYRNFPTRADLTECVYIASVDELVRYGDDLSGEDPSAALAAWLHRFVAHMAARNVPLTVLTRESAAYLPSREALYGVAGPLLERAQQAGAVRTDVDTDDVLRMIFAVTAGTYRDDAQRERAVNVILDGIRPARETNRR